MTTSRIKPSQRERKRYVLVDVQSDADLAASFAYDLVDEIEDTFGLMDAAKATVLVAKLYPSTQHVILRVKHSYVDELIDAVKRVSELQGSPVDVTTHVTSGVIRQVKEYYEEKTA